MFRKISSNPFLLSILSALLLSAAWYIYPLIAFVGFVPLFMLDAYFDKNIVKNANRKMFAYSYISFFLWNILVSWWIVNSTLIGATLAIVFNSLFMCVPIVLLRFAKKQFLRTKLAYLASNYLFIVFWVAFEYLHLNWDLTWTWLNVGNCFAFAHYFVQWYEFVGVLGGTIWILIVNILVFSSIKNIYLAPKLGYQIKKNIYATIFAIIIPCAISLTLYYGNEETGKNIEVVVVQPNIDSYTEKFQGTTNFIPFDAQLKRLLSLSKAKLTQNTQIMAWPETSLPVGFDEDLIEDQIQIKILREFLSQYPNLTLITGLDTYKIYASEFDKTRSARYGNGVGWYDYFNTALKIETNKKSKFYHKSKLVPGVEQMPYPELFKWIENFSIDLGGISGSLGTQVDRSVFSTKDSLRIAPIICYESIFGEFVGKYVQNNANILLIITNDGWWGNTPGHTQHLAYARLRALETRRSIARAANTGISGFLNQRGDILVQNKYSIQDAINYQIKTNDKITFYVKYGDYLGILGKWLSIGLILITLLLAVRFNFIQQK